MRWLRKFVGSVRHLPCHPQWLMAPRQYCKRIARLEGILVDVGCADRWVERQCGDRVDYIGVDFPTTGKYLYSARPDIFADAAKLPLATARIDTIVCLEVLEHVRDPNGALAEFARVLKPGGTLLLSMPFLYPIHDAPFDFQRLTEHGLRRDIDSAGFDIVTLEKTGHAVRTAGLLLSLAVVGGIYERRSWLDYLRMPFAAIVVLTVNVFAAALSLVTPDWGALGSGYRLEARRRPLVPGP